MPIVTLKSVLADARQGSYAVGAFNFNGLEDAQGILDAAVQKKSPVILMTSVSAAEYFGGPRAVAGYIHGLADKLDIPVVLHLDHAENEDFIAACIDSGYSSVMIDASRKPFEENIAITRQIVRYAQKFGVSVEAELGQLSGREEQVAVHSRDAAMTNPEDVPEFVAHTGIDALAVAIGTVHGFYKEEPKLDFDRLSRIAALTDVPLVLHGGTGVPEADFIRSIQCGIRKINVGTELKYCCSQTVRQKVSDLPDQIDIRKLAGPSRANCRDIVLHKIDLFGSAGRE